MASMSASEEAGALPTTPNPAGGSHGFVIPPTQPVNINRVHIPFLVVIAFIGVIIGGVVSMTVVYATTRAHVIDEQIHINQASAIQGGGVAYKQDVYAVERKFEQAMRAEHSKTRKMLKGMKISCRAGNRRGQLDCDITLPELD